MRIGNDYQPRRYAGLLVRGIAALIDLIIMALAIYGLFILDSRFLDINQYPDEFLFLDEYFTIRMFFIALGSAVIMVLYFSFFHASRFQATPGKMMVSIYVATPLNKRITLMNSFRRSLASVLSVLLGFGGYLVIPLTIQKTALHDWVAHTVVFQGRPTRSSIKDMASKF